MREIKDFGAEVTFTVKMRGKVTMDVYGCRSKNNHFSMTTIHTGPTPHEFFINGITGFRKADETDVETLRQNGISVCAHSGEWCVMGYYMLGDTVPCDWFVDAPFEEMSKWWVEEVWRKELTALEMAREASEKIRKSVTQEKKRED